MVHPEDFFMSKIAEVGIADYLGSQAVPIGLTGAGLGSAIYGMRRGASRNTRNLTTALAGLGLTGAAISSLVNNVKFQKEHGHKWNSFGRGIGTMATGPLAPIVGPRLANRAKREKKFNDRSSSIDEKYWKEIIKANNALHKARRLEGAAGARLAGGTAHAIALIGGEMAATSDDNNAALAGGLASAFSREIGDAVRNTVADKTPYGKELRRIGVMEDNAEEEKNVNSYLNKLDRKQFRSDRKRGL